MAQEKISELDAAKLIVETVSKLNKEQQERALRFASETLGILSGPLSSGSRDQQTGATNNVATQRAATTSPATNAPMDIRQFTALKSPKSDQQFAAIAAYYYQFEAPTAERRETINAEVLANAARLAQQRRPTRFALSNAKRSGFLDSAGSGEFKISTVGENLVAITLPTGTAERAGPSKKKASSKKKRKSRK